MGEVAVSERSFANGAVFLHPILLDSITQVLAVFRIENDKTYILKSIDRIEIRDSNVPEAFWVRATRHPGSESDTGQLTGDIDVFDESGKCFLEFGGVVFAYMDRVASVAYGTRKRA